ncbi:hypothetical protein FOZ62_021424, partial [Perkinsus olseni]
EVVTMFGLLQSFRPSASGWLLMMSQRYASLPSMIAAATAGLIGLKVLRIFKSIFVKAPFPGPGISFMLRLALMSTEDTFKEFMAMTKKFGKICCFKTPTRQVLVVSDMPTYRSVMKRRPREFSKPDYE